MSLQLKLKDDMKEALRAKDGVRLAAIRSVLTGITNELVAQKKKPSDELADEAVLAVIKRGVKQRKDSIEQFTSGGRPELAEGEEKELAILEKYLPATMDRDAIRAIAEAKKTELGIEDKAKMGMLMGALMKELKYKADGGDVKVVVEALFD